MTILANASKVHWNYYLALEHDLELAARYVEFSDANMGTYSIEFAHLLLAAASEVDVVAKLLCNHFSPQSPRNNIDDYRVLLTQHIPNLATLQLSVARYALTLTPWSNWASAKNPDWWRSYNNVKHERDAFFSEATLKNALNALSALHALTFYYYLHTAAPGAGAPLSEKETNRILLPAASFIDLPDEWHYSIRITE